MPNTNTVDQVPITDLMIGSLHRMMGTSRNQQIASIRTNIDQQSSLYQDLFRRLTEVAQTIESDKGRIKVLMSRDEENTHQLWEQIKGLDAIENFVIESCGCGDCMFGTVLAYTKPMYCVDDRTDIRHRIGRFKIAIDLHRRSIDWYNLDHTIVAFDGKSMQAPHVFDDGHACMGSSANHFSQLLGYRDIYQILILGIQFVESVNTADSAGAHIDKWPYEIDGTIYYYPTLTCDPNIRNASSNEPGPISRSGWVEKSWDHAACGCRDCVGEDYDEEEYDEDHYDEEENYDEEDYNVEY
jgi:hypothetical protein